VVFISTYGLSQRNRVIGQIMATVQGPWMAYEVASGAATPVRTGNLQ
jgi:hypothetical protein